MSHQGSLCGQVTKTSKYRLTTWYTLGSLLDPLSKQQYLATTLSKHISTNHSLILCLIVLDDHSKYFGGLDVFKVSMSFPLIVTSSNNRVNRYL